MSENIIGAIISGDISAEKSLEGILNIGSIPVAEKMIQTTGEFIASDTNNAEIIAHGLGYKPSMIIFFKKSGDPPTSSFNSFYTTICSVTSNFYYSHTYAVVQRLNYRYTVSGNTNFSYGSFYRNYHGAYKDAKDLTESTEPNYYYCTNFNETTFTTPQRIYAGWSYGWIAIK